MTSDCMIMTHPCDNEVVVETTHERVVHHTLFLIRTSESIPRSPAPIVSALSTAVSAP